MVAFTLTTLASSLAYRAPHTSLLISTFWPSNGVLTVGFLLAKGHQRWLVALIAAIANFVLEHYVARYTLGEAYLATLWNISEPALIAIVSQRMLGEEIDFAQLSTLLRFAALCAAPIVALTTTVYESVWPTPAPAPYGEVWLKIFPEEYLGIVMVAPALYAIAMPRPRDAHLFPRSRLEQVTLLVSLFLGELLLFACTSTPILFVVFPVLVGISFRLGPRGAAQAIIITSLLTFAYALLNIGALASLHEGEFGAGALAQAFVLTVVYSVLPAAGAIAQSLRSQQQLKLIHQELAEASRAAGRAETASNILHNVGNALNSVNVRAQLLINQAKNSRADSLMRLVEVLEREDLAAFVATERGQHLPRFLTALARKLKEERRQATTELTALQSSVEHINAIVATQQADATRVRTRQRVDLSKVVDDSLRLDAEDFGRHGIVMTWDFASLPPVLIDKHRVLEILINLIQNAKRACVDSQRADKHVAIQIERTRSGVTISVTDNGVGIAPEALQRIFDRGFPTRPAGHGFGLHSSALAARELGGTLTGHSDGLGTGARFTLELPLSGPAAQEAA